MATDVAPAADPSRPVHEGDDLIAADDAVAEVEHFDGSLTRLDTGATAHLGRLADADGRPHVVLRLGPGSSWHRTTGADQRHGQYEAHTPSAVAMARTATFVVRCDADGSARFATLGGTLVVRGVEGGTVVLHSGETVAAGPAGAMGEVGRPGVAALAEDDWVAVNDRLDDAPFVDEAPIVEDAPVVEQAPAPVEPTVLVGESRAIAHDSPTRTIEGAAESGGHPWRVGVGAVLAIGLGIASVVIGRSAATPSVPRDEQVPAVAVPGPPAFAAPAVTAPTVAAPAPTTTTTAPPASYKVTARSCVRRNGTVDYAATIRNHDAVTRDYGIRVHFVDRAGRALAVADVDVTGVPAGASRSFHVVGNGSGVRSATDCEVGTVEVR